MFARRPLALLRRVRACRRGSATVEFALLFPPVIILFLSALELGVVNIRGIMIDRGTDLVVRDLRLRNEPPPEPEALKARLCDAIGPMLRDCDRVIKITLHPINMTTWSPMPTMNDCVDRTQPYQPNVTANFAADNNLMLLRVCAVADPVLPHIGLGRIMPKDASGGYRLTAMTAFVNEPQ